VPPLSVLVVDDDPDTARRLAAGALAGAELRAADSLGEALGLLRDARWDAVLLSLDLPAVDLSLVERLIEAGTPASSLVLVTARPSMQTMLDASRMGTLGLLTSPVVPEELEALLRPPGASGEVVPIPESTAPDGEEAAIGFSPRMLEVFRMVGRISASSATVLVLGESGTGKELVARALHRNSPRSGGPFVALNCAAIPESLLESELFGHEKGAFTGAITRKIGRFERAHGGTLFLDEIGDMSLPLQGKILRALEEREIERVGGEGRIPIDVRVVAATHRDLRASIAAGEFREDLYFRLAVVTVELPSLVERGGDLDLLILHYAAVYAHRYGRSLRGIAREAMEVLRGHGWPGNVRELRNVLERSVLLAAGPVLLVEHLPLDQLRGGREQPQPGRHALSGYRPDLSLAEVEALHIREVLDRVDGHLGRASEVLGVHRNTLTRKVREYGLS
jgi:DNA-binding NtrC family response regulator